VTQLTLCVEGVLKAPIVYQFSHIYFSPGESSSVKFPVKWFRDITHFQGNGVPSLLIML
jgi:hypothetical protein